MASIQIIQNEQKNPKLSLAATHPPRRYVLVRTMQLVRKGALAKGFQLSKLHFDGILSHRTSTDELTTSPKFKDGKHAHTADALQFCYIAPSKI